MLGRFITSKTSRGHDESDMNMMSYPITVVKYLGCQDQSGQGGVSGVKMEVRYFGYHYHI